MKLQATLRNKFRETAREIVAQDRLTKKFGHSQNTVGAIARALEFAYELGAKGLLVNADRNDQFCSFETWENIPPTARNVLFYFSTWFGKRDFEVSSAERTLVKVVSNTKTQSWCRRSDLNCKNRRTFAQKGIGPLIKLGLLENAPQIESNLVLTDKGLATIREFRRRYEARDPMLPLLNVRP